MEQDYKKFGITDFYLLLIVLFWAVNFSFIKIALEEFTPLVFNSFRLLLASLILLFLLLLSGQGFSVPRRDIWKICVLGILGNTCFQLFFIKGIDLTTASNASVILAMSPVFVALLSTSFKHEKLHWAAWVGILISFVGFYLVITRQTGELTLSWASLKGDLTILLGVIFWACYTVFSQPLLKRISPLKLTSLTMAWGTLFFLPFCIGDLALFNYRVISFKVWILLFFSGLIALALGYIVWYASVKKVGSSKTAVYGNLVPIFAIAFAYVSIKERISLAQAAGVFIIIAGVYLARAGYRGL